MERANRDLAQGQTGQAQRAYSSLTDSVVDGAAARHNLGVIAEAMGLLPEAEAHYRQAVARDPNGARYHYSLGLALGRLGNLRGAAREFQDTVSLAPDYPGARFHLGRLMGLLGQFQEAQDQAEALLAHADTRFLGLCLRGDSRLLEQRPLHRLALLPRSLCRRIPSTRWLPSR